MGHTVKSSDKFDIIGRWGYYIYNVQHQDEVHLRWSDKFDIISHWSWYIYKVQHLHRNDEEASDSDNILVGALQRSTTESWISHC